MRKMYILTRNDISSSYAAAQGGHALAQMYEEGKTENWRNGYLIYLSLPYSQIPEWIWKLEKEEIPHAIWREPDQNNEITAIAAYPENGNIFKKLKLL